MTDVGFWRLAAADPERVAFIDADGTATTAGEAFAEVNRLSHGLRSVGLGTGDQIAMVMGNGTIVWEIYLAAMQTGLYYTPVNYHSKAAEIAHILADSGASLLIVSPEHAPEAGAAADAVGLAAERRFVDGAATGFRPLTDLTAGQPDTLPGDRVGGQLMQYTSGTTGRPKGVRRPISGIDADTATEALRWIFDAFGMVPGDDSVWLVAAPMYHTANILQGSIAVHFGMSVLTMGAWSPEECLDLIQRYRVTSTHMVPTQFVRLLKLPDAVRESYDIGSLRYVVHGAAPCPVEVKRRMMEWWGPVIYEYYGSTEVGGTFVRPEEWLERPGTVGRPFSISTLRIYDDEGVPVPANTTGTVYMRMGDDVVEYHGDPDKTRQAVRDGLMTVGDVGYVDDDGYLFLVGRDAELIISGGVNIYPSEAEDVLLEHPRVYDVAVVGVPDADFGEQVKAVVQPAGGPGDAALEQELIEFTRSRLATFKCPRSVDFVEALPRDPNGKLYKARVRSGYWADRERAI